MSRSAQRKAIGASLLMGVLNIVPRIIAAVLANSLTLYIDTIRSATETGGMFFSWLTVKRMDQNKDANFDYGLGKFENAAALLLVTAMTVTALIAGYSGINRLIHPQSVRSVGFGILVISLSTLVNATLWRKSYRAARAKPSPLIEAQWRLMRNKFIANIAVLLPLVMSGLFSSYSFARYLDPVSSLVLCMFICITNYRLLTRSMSAILDRTLDEHLQIAILRNLVQNESLYRLIHGIRSRHAGNDIFIELFLEFDDDQPMHIVQNSIDTLRISIEKEIPHSQVLIIPSREAVLKLG